MKSIRLQMLVYLLVFTVVLFSVFGFFLLRQINTIPAYIQSKNQAVAEAHANEISKELQGALDQVQMLAQSSLIQSMDMDEIKDFLPSMVLEKHRNMTISDVDGQAWSTVGDTIDISEQEQYESIILGDAESYISNPFYSPFIPEDFPILTVSHRIYNGEDTVGLINVVLTSVFINEVISEVTFLDSGYAYIIDDEGFIVAHPNESKDITHHLSDWIVKSDEALEQFEQNNGSFIYENADGEEYVIVFATIDAVPRWTFIIEVPLTEAYAIYTSTVFYFYMGLAGLIVIMVVFAFLYSKRLSTPISNLITTFEKAAAGDLSVRAKAHARHELGRAGESFNSMLQKIKILTYRDPITGMYNLNSFMLELKEKLNIAKKHAQKTYIIIVSIDDFKRINTLGGYAVGNQVLKKMSNRILELIGEDELAGRYFGDEVIMMLTLDHKESIEKRLGVVYEALNAPFEIGSTQYQVHSSIGASEIHYADDDYNHAIHEATIAKVDAKRMRGKPIAYYNDTMNNQIIEEQMMEEALMNALDYNEFYLVYQPIYQSDKENMVGMEALLRWKHPQFKDHDVLDWIRILERKGLIYAVGNWVLETAIDQVVYWNKVFNKNLFISINVSVLQLEDTRFEGALKEIMDKINIAPELIHLEITESELMRNIEDNIVILNTLKMLGIKLSLDDFGTGYSSLAYLMKLPVDILKVDRGFVGSMFVDEKSSMIIETIATLAKTMQVIITAEGVETEAQFKRLKNLSCDYYQGYWFKRPLEPRLMTATLKKEKM